MAERSKTLDSKSSKGQPFGGSNPPLSVFLFAYKAPFGQFLTHSIQRMHSVPFFLFLELSVTSTFIGHTLLHFPQEMHLSLSHFTLNSEK